MPAQNVEIAPMDGVARQYIVAGVILVVVGWMVWPSQKGQGQELPKPDPVVAETVKTKLAPVATGKRNIVTGDNSPVTGSGNVITGDVVVAGTGNTVTITHHHHHSTKVVETVRVVERPVIVETVRVVERTVSVGNVARPAPTICDPVKVAEHEKRLANWRVLVK